MKPGDPVTFLFTLGGVTNILASRVSSKLWGQNECEKVSEVKLDAKGRSTKASSSAIVLVLRVCHSPEGFKSYINRVNGATWSFSCTVRSKGKRMSKFIETYWKVKF